MQDLGHSLVHILLLTAALNKDVAVLAGKASRTVVTKAHLLPHIHKEFGVRAAAEHIAKATHSRCQRITRAHIHTKAQHQFTLTNFFALPHIFHLFAPGHKMGSGHGLIRPLHAL